jgi:protein SCO1/2
MIRTSLLLLTLVAPAYAESTTTGEFALERLAIPQVALIDQYAREQAFKGPLTDGQILVVNFNYTTCESICPIGNDVMAELDDLLAPDAPVRLLSITIDPGRDTPAQMRKAADSFGASDRWSWLTGEPAEVSRLLAAFDADFANIVLHDPVFLVGDLDSQRFYRSQSMPLAKELAGLVASLIP